MSRFRSSAASAALGAAFAAVTFAIGSGTQLGRTSTVLVLLVLVSGAVVALGVLLPRPGPLYGGGALLAFIGLTFVTALSLGWSIAPDATLEDTALTFAYLGVFAAGLVAARVARQATPILLSGVLIATVTVAVWALLTRVFPGDLGSQVLAARLSEPFGYSNALGCMMAIGMPAALWLGTRRGGLVSSALGYPALAVLLLTALLTQSRGALGAAAICLLIWLAVVPLRLRSIAQVSLTGLAVAPVAAWALSKDAFTKLFQPDSVREAVAGDFTLMLLAVVAVTFAAGLAVHAASTRRAPSLTMRRRAGLALAVLAGALVLGGIGSVAASDDGLGGTISNRVDEIRDEQTGPPKGAGRLGSVSSARGTYWRQAYRVFDERPSVGLGAGAFGLASLRHRRGPAGAEHAHGFIPQTASDLGLVGLAVLLMLLAAWLVAVARSTGLQRRRPRAEWDSERIAVTALALCPVVFGLHSMVDWVWFIVGPTVVAMAAAGFVAGRGPLGRAAPQAPRFRPSPPRIVAAAAVMVTAALCAWAVWQPERAARAAEHAVELAEDGKPEEALEEAERAREINRYSADPLYARADVLDLAGRSTAAYRALELAVIEHPRDPETWLRLARFELDVLDLPARAVQSAGGALRVDRYSRKGSALQQEATQAATP